MTVNKGPHPNDTLNAVVDQYSKMRTSHLRNELYIQQRDPRATPPPEMWILGINIPELLRRARKAEVFTQDNTDIALD